MLFRSILLLALLTFCFDLAFGQQSDPLNNPNDSVSADKGSRSRNQRSEMIGDPQQEMLARRDIETAEKDHQENVDRAREAAQLSTEIRDSFIGSKTLGRTEVKKLERLEKLARKIRSEAGGSGDDVALDPPPREIDSALARLAEISDKLRKGVENTPRQVVSASVIEHTNEVLELIRYVRTYAH